MLPAKKKSKSPSIILEGTCANLLSVRHRISEGFPLICGICLAIESYSQYVNRKWEGIQIDSGFPWILWFFLKQHFFLPKMEVYCTLMRNRPPIRTILIDFRFGMPFWCLEIPCCIRRDILRWAGSGNRPTKLFIRKKE